MSQPVISVEGLGKRYVIQHEKQQDTLRDALHQGARRLWRRFRWGTGFTEEEFWALRDISFEVQPGEVVGIIGRNGAGKSTLLKILSRITEPTTGTVRLRGRVASLLEVGTGFHPELSGRENIYLNGAILGMSRMEIRRKFDEIVAFAEVERFLDTPVKRYSSGMYVRLAFAVAAHLEPEILIVDEVLAVGDHAFQSKCLGKMKSVASNEGRTVLFVSHNLAATQSLCNKVISLRQGSVSFVGPTAEAIGHYLTEGRNLSADQSPAFSGRDPAVCLNHVTYRPDPQNPTIAVNLTIRCVSPHRLGVEFLLSTPAGAVVAFADAGSLDASESLDLNPGEHTFCWNIDASRLANGTYFLAVQLVDPGLTVHIRHEHSTPLELCRPPTPSSRRVLEQSWQAGHVQLQMRRVHERDGAKGNPVSP